MTLRDVWEVTTGVVVIALAAFAVSLLYLTVTTRSAGLEACLAAGYSDVRMRDGQAFCVPGPLVPLDEAVRGPKR